MRYAPAHAKLNLALEVVARRADGFHELSTVFCTIDWHDLVGVDVGDPVDPAAAPAPGPAAGVRPGDAAVVSRPDATTSPRLCITGAVATPAMLAAEALVPRAAAALGRLAAAPVAITVEVAKRLPVGAGLGGGSADAAAVLRLGAAELSARGVDVEVAVLAAWAAALGSDVPFLLGGGAALGGGRGEILTSLPLPRLHLAVAVAAECSTAAAYSALTDADLGDQGRARRVAAALAAGRPPDGADLGSALEAGACRAEPALGAALERLRGAVPGHRWHLTGSGGAAFALASTAADARRLAAAATAAGIPARACRSAPGAAPDAASRPLHFAP